MAKSVNKVILIGNVGGDPDVKYTPGGIPLAKFGLATNESYKAKSGEWQERVEWHHIIAWQHLAEIVGEFVQKGKKLYIEGRLQTSSWEDRQSGEKKYRTEIVAQTLLLLGSGNGNGNANGHSASGQESGGPSSRQPTRRHEAEILPAETGITDEDIPF